MLTFESRKLKEEPRKTWFVIQHFYFSYHSGLKKSHPRTRLFHFAPHLSTTLALAATSTVISGWTGSEPWSSATPWGRECHSLVLRQGRRIGSSKNGFLSTETNRQGPGLEGLQMDTMTDGPGFLLGSWSGGMTGGQASPAGLTNIACILWGDS